MSALPGYAPAMATIMNIDRYRVVCTTSLLSGSVLFQDKKTVAAAERTDENGFNKAADVFHVHIAVGQIHTVERITSRGRHVPIKDPAERKLIMDRGRRLGMRWEERMRKRAKV